MDRFVSLIDARQDSQCVIKTHLANARGFVLRCMYSSAEEAFHEIPTHSPDVVLTNIRLPGMSGIECVHTLKKILPRLPVVLLAEEVKLTDFLSAFQVGADGYFILPGNAETLQQTLQYALDGWKSFSKEFQSLLVQRLAGGGILANSKMSLTPAEQKIMSHLILGCSDKEIAALAGISSATVHSFTSHIYKKLGAHHRREAVAVFLGFNRESAGDEPPVARETASHARTQGRVESVERSQSHGNYATRQPFRPGKRRR